MDGTFVLVQGAEMIRVEGASDGGTGTTLPDGRQARVPRLPIRMAGRPPGYARGLPAIGDDTADVPAELGYNHEQIERLHAAGAIGDATPLFPQPEI